MLTKERAKEIGLNACTEKMGPEFCREHADMSMFGYGIEGKMMHCYLGIDDKPESDDNNMNMKTLFCGNRYAPYYVQCDVSMLNGEVTYTDWCVPERT